MDPKLPAVLLMGGGEGMGPVKKTALALGESLFDQELGKPIGQLIIICGRNKSLVSTLEAQEWKIPVKVTTIYSFDQQNRSIMYNRSVQVHSGYTLASIHFNVIFPFRCRLEVLRPRWRSGWELVIAL